MLNAFSRYIRETRNPVYSFILIFPLIILYEILILLTRPRFVARAGVWADWILNLVNVNTVFGKMLLVSLLIIVIGFFSLKKKRPEIRIEYFPLMFLESIVYAYFFANAVFFVRRSILLGIFSSNEGLVLSIGAGFYEELFFRLIPILLLKIFIKQGDKKTLYILAVVLFSSLLFSLFHYIGYEAFSFDSFIFRFISSVILFIIFLTRGFGIAVYTHTIYDIMCFY